MPDRACPYFSILISPPPDLLLMSIRSRTPRTLRSSPLAICVTSVKTRLIVAGSAPAVPSRATMRRRSSSSSEPRRSTLADAYLGGDMAVPIAKPSQWYRTALLTLVAGSVAALVLLAVCMASSDTAPGIKLENGEVSTRGFFWASEVKAATCHGEGSCGTHGSCQAGQCRCHGGYSGPDCQTEPPWLAVAYGFDVHRDKPYFIRKAAKLFEISTDDVDVISENHADGHTFYSTSEKTIAERTAIEMGVGLYFGAFSAVASMSVSDSAEMSIKTVRLDSFVRFNQQRAMASGTFLTHPHTKLDRSIKAYIEGVGTSRIQDIESRLGSFYARSANLGGVVQKAYTKQMTESDTEASVKTALRGGNHGLIGGEGSFTRGSSTDEKGVQLSWSFHAEGGDTKLWLNVNDDGTNFNDVKKKWVASFAADGHNLYPWGMELRPIWEVVEQVDFAKGLALKEYLTQKWERQAHAFSPVNVITSVPRAVEIRGAMGRSWGHLNGIYNRMTVKHCNGKPVYWGSFYDSGKLTKYSYLYQPSGSRTSEWQLSDSERVASCAHASWIYTRGLVCDARCCARPDCAGRWMEWLQDASQTTSPTRRAYPCGRCRAPKSAVHTAPTLRTPSPAYAPAATASGGRGASATLGGWQACFLLAGLQPELRVHIRSLRVRLWLSLILRTCLSFRWKGWRSPEGLWLCLGGCLSLQCNQQPWPTPPSIPATTRATNKNVARIQRPGPGPQGPGRCRGVYGK